MTLRLVVLLLAASAAGAQDNPPAAADPAAPSATTVTETPAREAVDPVEDLLQRIEKAVAAMISGRAHLDQGMHELAAEKKIKSGDLRKVCEIAGDQSKLISTIRKRVAELEQPKAQGSMSTEQKDRLAKVKATVDQVPEKMDCSAF